jgi:hypothetical protein
MPAGGAAQPIVRDDEFERQQELTSHEDWARAAKEAVDQQHIALNIGGGSDASERHVPSAQSASGAGKVPMVAPNWDEDSEDEARDSVHLGLATFNEYGEDTAGNELFRGHVELTITPATVNPRTDRSHTVQCSAHSHSRLGRTAPRSTGTEATVLKRFRIGVDRCAAGRSAAGNCA